MVLFAAFTQFSAITTVCLIIYLTFFHANIYSQEGPNRGELFRPSNNPTLNIPIEGGATSLVINPNANKTYIGTTNEQLVIRNDSSGMVLGNVTLEDSPQIISINPSNNRIYIATENSNNVTVIDDSARNITFLDDIVLEDSPQIISINPSNNRIYIATENSNNVTVIDDSARNITFLDDIVLEDSPQIISINPSNNRIYIATENSNNVTVIDDSANRTKYFLNVGLKIKDIKVNPSLNKIYITFADGKRISVFDEKSDTIRSIYGNYSYIGDHIIVDDKKNLIYVINSDQGRISIIDSNLDKVIKTNIQFYQLDEDESLTDFDLKPNDDRIYIATLVEGEAIHFIGRETIFNNRGGILIIEGSKLLESDAPDIKTPTIKVANEPDSIAVDSTFNKVYISHSKSDRISITDGKSDKLIGSIEIKNPDKLYFNQNDNKTYLTTSDNKILVIDRESFQILNNKTIDIDSVIRDISIDNQNDRLFISSGDGLEIRNSNNNILDINPADLTANVLDIDTKNDFLYLAHRGGTVDIMSTEYQDRQVNLLEVNKVKVGKIPMDIAVNPLTNKVYVVNQGSDSVSVIDPFIEDKGKLGKAVATITVGQYPTSISINPLTNLIYISNSHSDSISVINGSNDRMIKEIKVGDRPNQVSINPLTNKVYAVNQGSDSVSVIDGVQNQVLAGITFSVNPPESGYIRCEQDILSTNQYTRLTFNTPCEAIPNKGFEFSTWIKHQDNNSTKTISGLTTSNEWYSGFINWFKSLGIALGLINSNSAASEFKVTEYGNYTANFQVLPPPIPQENLIGLYTLAATIFTGWLIPNIARHINASNQKRHALRYFTKISNIDKNGKDDIESHRLKEEIDYAYTKGKINESQYKLLNEKISESRENKIK